jgi:hypothetical protein
MLRSGTLMSDRDHERNTCRRVDGIRKNMQMRSGDDVRNTRRYDRTDSLNDVQSENYGGYGRKGVGCWYCREHNHLIPLIFKKLIWILKIYIVPYQHLLCGDDV